MNQNAKKLITINNYDVYFDQDDGFSIVSPYGKEYDILEGKGAGGWTSSDIGFIYCYEDCKVIDFFFGVGALTEYGVLTNDSYTMDYLVTLVEAIEMKG